MLAAISVQLRTRQPRNRTRAHHQCRVTFCFLAHECKTLDQTFQLAAMLLEIVWACMKGIIKTKKGCEAEFHTSVKCKKEGLTPLQKPQPTWEQIIAVQLMYP